MTKTIGIRDQDGDYVGYCESVDAVYNGDKLIALQLKELVLDDQYVQEANVDAWDGQ